MVFNNDVGFVDHFRGLGLEVGIEIPMLQKIIFNPELVVFVPREDYEHFWELLMEQEYYELLPKLKQIEPKIKDISLRHFKRFY